MYMYCRQRNISCRWMHENQEEYSFSITKYFPRMLWAKRQNAMKTIGEPRVGNLVVWLDYEPMGNVISLLYQSYLESRWGNSLRGQYYGLFLVWRQKSLPVFFHITLISNRIRLSLYSCFLFRFFCVSPYFGIFSNILQPLLRDIPRIINDYA